MEGALTLGMVEVLRMTHLERLFQALYLSEGGYSYWVLHCDDDDRHMKRFALWQKTRAIILYDRVMCKDTRVLRKPTFKKKLRTIIKVL